MIDIRLFVFYVKLKVYLDQKKTIKFFRSQNIEDLLERHDMLKVKTTQRSIQEISLIAFVTAASEVEKAKYLARVDSILNAMVKTLVDIVFAIFMLGRFAQNLSWYYFHAIDQILIYQARKCEISSFYPDKKFKNLKKITILHSLQ